MALKAITAILCCAIPLMGSVEEAEKYQARVKVTVSAEESIKKEILSYINRELRSLGDVVLLDENQFYDYEMEIVAMKVHLADRPRQIGVALSVVITSDLTKDYTSLLEKMLGVLVEGTGRRGRERTRIVMLSLKQYWWRSPPTRVISHKLLTGPQDKLQGICQEIVADFDQDVLEIGRRSWQATHPEITPGR